MDTISILKNLVILDISIVEACSSMINPMNLPILEEAYMSIKEGTYAKKDSFVSTILSTIRLDIDPIKIKKAYRTKSKVHHPDKGGDPKKFIELTRAYKLLTDPSYAQKVGETPDIKLAVTLGLSIDFLAALFGMNLTIVMNLEELKSDGSPVTIGVKDKDKEFKLPVKKISVRIPACSRTNDEIQVSKAGLSYMGEVGDLTFVLSIPPHPKFSLDDRKNLLFKEEVDLDIMLNGGIVDIATPFGIKPLPIPVGTKPDTVIVLKNTVPQEGFTKTLRDMHITIAMKYPNRGEMREKTFWKNLKIDWSSLDTENMSPDALSKLAEEASWDLEEEEINP